MSAVVLLFSALISYLIQDTNTNTKILFDDGSYMDDVSIVQKRKGSAQWMVYAKKAVFLNNTDVILSDLKIMFPERGLTINSSEGLFNIESKDLEIKDNVKAFANDYEIEASMLRWDSSRNEVISDNKVQVRGKGFFLEGDSFRSSSDKVVVNKNVKAVFHGK